MKKKRGKSAYDKFDFLEVLSLKTRKFSKPLYDEIFNFDKSYKIDLDIKLHEYQLLRVILGSQDKIVEIGQADKIRSQFIFKFVEEDFRIADTKYGIRCESLQKQSNNLLETEIKRIIRFFEKELRVIKKTAPYTNHVQLIYQNQYSQFKQTFEYFNQQAQKKIRRSKSSSMSDLQNFRIPELAGFFSREVRFRERHYASLMSVTAFYAYLEHLIALLFPLSSAMGAIGVEKFSNLDLFAKWDKVMPKNHSMDEHKIKLKTIYSDYRNLYIHGGAPRKIADLDALVFDLLIPSNSEKLDFLPGYFHLNAPKAVGIYAENLAKVFEEFINYIEEDEHRIGVLYIKEGLPILLGKKLNAEFQQKRKNRTTYLEWVTSQSAALDRHMNADFY